MSQHGLNFGKGVRVNEGGDIGIRVFLSIIMVNANILLVFQESMDAVDRERVASAVPQSFRIEPLNDVLLCLACGVHLKNAPYQRGGLGVKFQVLVRAGAVTQGDSAAHTLSLSGHIGHTSFHIGGKLNRVVLGHSLQYRLQDNALRGVRDALRRVENFDSVLLATVLVERDLFSVSAKSVDFPDDNGFELVLGRILQHLLKLLPVIVSPRLRPVNVFVNNGVVVLFRKFVGGGQLPFDGLLSLLMARISGIDNGIHSRFTSLIGSRSRASRAVFLSFKLALS